MSLPPIRDYSRLPIFPTSPDVYYLSSVQLQLFNSLKLIAGLLFTNLLPANINETFLFRSISGLSLINRSIIDPVDGLRQLHEHFSNHYDLQQHLTKFHGLVFSPTSTFDNVVGQLEYYIQFFSLRDYHKLNLQYIPKLLSLLPPGNLITHLLYQQTQYETDFHHPMLWNELLKRARKFILRYPSEGRWQITIADDFSLPLSSIPPVTLSHISPLSSITPLSVSNHFISSLNNYPTNFRHKLPKKSNYISPIDIPFKLTPCKISSLAIIDSGSTNTYVTSSDLTTSSTTYQPHHPAANIEVANGNIIKAEGYGPLINHPTIVADIVPDITENLVSLNDLVSDNGIVIFTKDIMVATKSNTLITESIDDVINYSKRENLISMEAIHQINLYITDLDIPPSNDNNSPYKSSFLTTSTNSIHFRTVSELVNHYYRSILLSWCG
jgi:hypothetical protein